MNTLSRFVFALFFILFYTFTNLSSQCIVDLEILNINDNTSISAVFPIEGAVNDDLSSPLQGLCGISLTFTHDAVSDVNMELVSPSGQSVTLVGSPSSSGTTTLGSRWNITFTSCSNSPSPDAGINGTWDNNESWTNFGNYNGTYYPHSGCLEDFNMGSVNGDWQLIISDVGQFNSGRITGISFIFCDETSIECRQCNPNAGLFSNNSFEVCENDNLILDFSLTGENQLDKYDYLYMVSRNDNLINFRTQSNFSDLSPGSYEICGISVLSTNRALLINSGLTYNEIITGYLNNSLPFCIDITDVCATLVITDAPTPTQISATTCPGVPFLFNGNTFTDNGTYLVNIPISGQCDSTVLLNLDVIDIEPIINASATEFSCMEATIILNAFNSRQETISNFSWSTPDGNIITDHNQNIININSPGTYFLQQEEEDCIADTFITISTSSEIPSITLIAPSLSCTNSSVQIQLSTSATINSADWTGPFNFSSTEIEPEVSFPGRYNVTYTDISGCSISDFIDVTPGNDVTILSLSADTITCEQSFVSLNINDNIILNNIQWSGPNNFNSNLEVPEINKAGIYHISGTDLNGCNIYGSIEVIGNPQSFDYEIYGNKFLCPGGRVEIGASTSVDDAFYSWIGPNNFFSNEPINMVSQIGIYQLEIIANGCIVRDSIRLIREVDALPDYEISIDTLGDCSAPLFQFNAVPLVNEFAVSQLVWVRRGISTIGIGPNIQVSEYGDYLLQIRTYSGCAINEVFSLNPPDDSPQITIDSIGNITCAGGGQGLGSIKINGGPDFTYVWSGPSGFSSENQNIDSLNSGVYTILVTDTLTGCIFTRSFPVVLDTIKRNTFFNISEINCIHSEAIIQVATSGGGVESFFWTGPNGFSGTTRDIIAPEGGDYILTTNGNNGCIGIDTISIIPNFDPPLFTAIDSLINCDPYAVSLTTASSNPGTIFSWIGPNDFESNSSGTVAYEPGDYKVIAIGRNGCSDSLTIPIIINPFVPDISSSVSGVLDCIDTLAALTGSSQTPNVQYFWDGPNDFMAAGPSVTTGFPGEYILNVVDPRNCVGSDTINVEQVIILPEYSLSFDSISCISLQATMNASSSDNDATFTWQGPNGYNMEGANTTSMDTGTYILSVIGANACVSTDTFQLSLRDITISDDLLLNCFEPGIRLSQIDTSFISIVSWEGPNGFSSTAPYPIINENGSYTGNITGNNGCLASVILEIEVDKTSPDAFITASNDLICEIQNAELSSAGSSIGQEFDYTWFTNDGIIQSDITNPEIIIEGQGNYGLMVTNVTNGCTDTMMISITELPANDISFNTAVSDPLCAGERQGTIAINNVLGGNSPYRYSLDGINFREDAIFSQLLSGNYVVSVKDAAGCTTSSQASLLEGSFISVDLGEDIYIFLGDEIDINAATETPMSELTSIDWFLSSGGACSNCLNFTLTPLQDLSVQISITNQNGCIATDMINVIVDQDPILYRPNIFSPNEDGINDIFYVSSNRGVAFIHSIHIFDRWGNKVFENTNFLPGDIGAGWDGRYKGSNMLPGVYVYVLDTETINGLRKEIRGNVTLVR